MNVCLVIPDCANPNALYPQRIDRIDKLSHPESVVYIGEVRSGGDLHEWDHADHFHSDLWDSPQDPIEEGLAWIAMGERSNYLFSPTATLRRCSGRKPGTWMAIRNWGSTSGGRVTRRTGPRRFRDRRVKLVPQPETHRQDAGATQFLD